MKVRPFNWLACSFFGYFCAYGVFVPFFPSWLKSQAYTEETIGILLAFAYVFRFIGGIIFANRIKQPSQLLNSLRGLSWASVVLAGFIAFSAQHFWLLFIALALFSMVNSAGIPLTDTLAATWQQQVKLDYGKARLIGSAAFVVGVTLFGNLIGLLGEQHTLWILIGLLVVYALLQTPSPQPEPLDEYSDTAKKAVSFSNLLSNRTTLRLLFAAALIQGSHAGYYAYSVLYWTELGISVKTTSLLWGLAVSSEILLFFFSGRLLKNIKISTLFYITAITAVIRWGVFSINNELWLFIVLQTLHSITFAMMHYAMMRYISTQPQYAMAKLQSLYNGLVNCVGIAAMTALAGMLYPISGQMVFVTMMIVAAIALLLIPRKIASSLEPVA